MNFRFRTPALLLLAGVLAGCGPDPLEGRVALSGSATLTPLATAAVDRWKQAHPKVEARVDAIGSDAGLERLIRFDDADFALLSRPVLEADRVAARTVGKELVVVPVAWDAVCLVVPKSNTWAASLTREQAALAFSTAQTWSDLDPSWPKQTVHRFVLGPNSGTAEVLSGALFPRDRSRLYSAPGVQASEDDHILARGIAGVDGSLGFLGWATYRESPSLRLVALDGVEPSVATIQDRSYGLPRQLWLVATRQGLETRPAALSFLRYLSEQSLSLTAQFGLVPLSDAERAAVAATLAQLVKS